MRTVLGFLALASLAAPLAAQSTVTCTSNGNARQECRADTRNGVLLQHERSNGVCQQGSTWGYNRRGIYVSGGCSAEFLVSNGGNASGGNGYSNNQGQNGYGNNGNNYSNNGQNGYGNNGNNYNNNGQNANGNGQNSYGNNGQNSSGQRRVTIPAGTQIQVRLEQAVDSNNVKQGDIIPATLVNDLVVNGTTVAPAGTEMKAKVAAIRSGSTYPLSVKLDSMTVNGERYTFSSNAVHSARDSQSGQDTANNNGGALGAALGALNTLSNGNGLPSGSVYTFRLLSSARASSTGSTGNSR